MAYPMSSTGAFSCWSFLAPIGALVLNSAYSDVFMGLFVAFHLLLVGVQSLRNTSTEKNDFLIDIVSSITIMLVVYIGMKMYIRALRLRKQELKKLNEFLQNYNKKLSR